MQLWTVKVSTIQLVEWLIFLLLFSFILTLWNICVGSNIAKKQNGEYWKPCTSIKVLYSNSNLDVGVI